MALEFVAASESTEGSIVFTREVEPHDFHIAGCFVYFFHEDNVANMNELNFDGATEFTDLTHIELLGLCSVQWSAVVTPKHRHFAVISRISPFGYDFLEACEDNPEGD
jgi:hypothetical protein